MPFSAKPDDEQLQDRTREEVKALCRTVPLLLPYLHAYDSTGETA